MTDLERKLAETLREQGGEVTPNLDAAWAEQQRRRRKPQRRRRVAVWVAPLAAVLVVLTSVLLATQLNTASAPVPPAKRGQELHLAKFSAKAMDSLAVAGTVRLIDFAGQTDSWTAYAFGAFEPGGRTELFCVAAVPVGQRLDPGAPLYGIDSPRCVSTGGMPLHGVRAGYVGESGGPLPPGKAVYFTDAAVRTLRLFAANGDLTQARSTGQRLSESLVFVADADPGSPPVRFEVS